jgi:hypothetical protein
VFRGRAALVLKLPLNDHIYICGYICTSTVLLLCSLCCISAASHIAVSYRHTINACHVAVAVYCM